MDEAFFSRNFSGNAVLGKLIRVLERRMVNVCRNPKLPFSISNF
jgi:hypothetical protein